MKKIIFYGGTGQCKVMKAIAEKSNYEVVAILDDTEKIKKPFSDIPFFNGANCLERFLSWKNKKYNIENSNIVFLVTIGNPSAEARISISNKLENLNFKNVSLIHQNAIIENYTSVGKSCQIHAGVIINPFAKIGNYCILNTRSLIEHDDVLKDGVEIGPGAVLCGNVSIGKNTWIGANSVIKQNVKIGKNCIIGAGSTIIDNIPDNKTVVGLPARRYINEKN